MGLGLLEVSPDEALRVPRILPVQLGSDGEGLYKQAAEVLYRLWWEEGETSSEEQKLEIHRLALLGKEEKIAVKFTTTLTRQWVELSRYRQTVELCRSTLKVFEHYSILHELAISESNLGEIDKALDYLQPALEILQRIQSPDAEGVRQMVVRVQDLIRNS